MRVQGDQTIRGFRKECLVGPGSRDGRGFSLLELIIVIAIMGLLAALTVPSLKNAQRSNALASASQQLLDDVALARRVAIKDRTTVMMVFMPPVDTGSASTFSSLNRDEQAILLRAQQSAYALYVERQVGDQPGSKHPRYVRPWRTLPAGFFIPQWKFSTVRNPILINATNSIERSVLRVWPFMDTPQPIPVPNTRSPRAVNVRLPYIAFGPLGQLQEFRDGQFEDALADEYIPLGRGSVLLARDDTDPKRLVWAQADISERPPNNSIDDFHLIVIDRLTGRARVARQEINP